LSYRGTVLGGPNSSGDREPFVVIPPCRPVISDGRTGFARTS